MHYPESPKVTMISQPTVIISFACLDRKLHILCPNRKYIPARSVELASSQYYFLSRPKENKNGLDQF